MRTIVLAMTLIFLMLFSCKKQDDINQIYGHWIVFEKTVTYLDSTSNVDTIIIEKYSLGDTICKMDINENNIVLNQNGIIEKFNVDIEWRTINIHYNDSIVLYTYYINNGDLIMFYQDTIKRFIWSAKYKRYYTN